MAAEAPLRLRLLCFQGYIHVQSAAQNIEFALMTRVIDTRDFHTLEKLKINEDYFNQAETKEVYRWLKMVFNHPTTAGQVPSREMVQMHFPGFYFFPSTDTVAILSQQLRQERLRIQCTLLGQDLINLSDRNPQEAIAVLRQRSMEIASISEVTEDLSMSSVYSQLLQRYETLQQTQGLLGIPYPWDALNEALHGMQGSQFIIIYGRPKSMKTWIAAKIATHAYLKARRRVLFYTREMSPFQIAQRIAALIAEVDYGRYTAGKLSPEVMQEMFFIIKQLAQDDQSFYVTTGSHQPYFIIVSDRNSGPGGGGVGWLKSKIREYQPDLVVVDGMYLMSDDRTGKRTIDWKNVTHISQDLKLAAQEFDIPLIGVTQAKREAEHSMGENMGEMSYADAFGQDTDAAFRVIKKSHVDTAGVKHQELWLLSPGMREGIFDGIVINGQPATNFNFIRNITPEDMMKDLKEATMGGSDPKKHVFKNSLTGIKLGVPPK